MENFNIAEWKKNFLNENKEEKKETYTVYFTHGVDDNDDVEVEASSPKEAVALVKPGIIKKYKKARGFMGRIKHDL